MVHENKSLRKIALILVVVALLLTTVSCRMFRRPTPQGGNMPSIPKSIARGNRQEPEIRVYMHETGEVKTMAFEEYLLGVVAAEMDTAWPPAALAAQAIVARTFTLDKIAKQGGVPDKNADASTDIQEFQAYDASRINDNVRKAVKDTRGMTLSFQGEFIRAWFSAYCDGMTSTAEDGLAFREFPTPFITRVKDICPQAAPEDVRGYTASFTKTQVNAALGEIGQTPGSYSQVQIVTKDPAGRAVTVRIGQASVSAPALRIALGSTELRSTKWSSVKIEGDKVIFVGSGYGHGVGLCQWGAKARADQGNTYEQIVKAFFPNTQLGKIWD